MTRIEFELSRTDNRIEESEKMMESLRSWLKSSVDSERWMVEADTILHYAQKLQKEALKLSALREKKELLEDIAKEAQDGGAD